MRIHPASFVLGLGAACVLPLFSRVLRPLMVEAAVAGMGLVDQGRRLVAEQIEVFEDIAAEARARREEILAGDNGHFPDAGDDAPDGDDAPPRPRRRASATGRRRPS